MSIAFPKQRFLRLHESCMHRFADTEKHLRRDLKRTKALLQDAQVMLEKNKEGGSRATIKQLRNQVHVTDHETLS